MAGLRDTVYMDPDLRHKLLARLATARSTNPPRTPASGGLKNCTSPVPKAVLRVIAGRTDRRQYELGENASLIGRAETALVRLHGWLKPSVAAAITRNDGSYLATAIRGKTLVNGRRLPGRCALKHGDVLEVGGVTLEFRVEP